MARHVVEYDKHKNQYTLKIDGELLFRGESFIGDNPLSLDQLEILIQRLGSTFVQEPHE